MVWVKPRLNRIINLGFYETLAQELRLVDESDYKKILHMTPQNFDDGYFGTYQDNTTETSRNICVIRDQQTLAATIRFLATGDKYIKRQSQL